MAIPTLRDTALRLTDCVYFGDSLSEAAANAAVPDGDKGDITVSGTGLNWQINAGVVSTNELGGTITAAGKAILDDPTAADQRGTLGLGPTDSVKFDSLGLGVPGALEEALHIARIGTRAGIYLDGQGAGGYGGLKLGANTVGSEWLISSGYGGVTGFRIRDTNAAADRLTISDTGAVTVAQGLSAATLTGTGLTNGHFLAAGVGGIVTGADAATTRTNLGLGTIATQAASSVSITGGAISGVTVSASSVTATGLTSGYLPVAGTGGLLGDSNVSVDANAATVTSAGITGFALATTRGNANDRNWGIYTGASDYGMVEVYVGASAGAAPSLPVFSITRGGNVLIGTATSTGPKLEVAGSISGTSLTATGLTSGRIPVAGTGGLLGDGPVTVSGTNVGIGTPTPLDFLTVQNAGTWTGVGNFYRVFDVLQDQTNYRGVYLGYDSSGQIGVVSPAGASGQLAFWRNNGTTWAETMRLDSTGNVGIGTTNPVAKLEVDGDIKATAIKLTTGASNGYVWKCTNADGSGSWQAFTGGMTYKGTWDASTNTPTLSDGTGVAGDTYSITVGASRDLGSGSKTWTAGGWAIHNGTIWEPVASSVSVTSVNGLTGAVSLVLGGGSSSFANQGTTTTVLHGNAAGNPSWAAVSLTADVSGTLPLGNGGTGQTTAQAAMNALAGGVTSGSYLRGNGTNVVLSAIQAGDVPTLNQNTTGTAAGLSATLAVASGGTGATTLTGLVRGNGTSPITGGATVALGSEVSGTLPVANGGTGVATATAGEFLFGAGTSAFSSTPNVKWDSTLHNLLVTADAGLTGGDCPLQIVGNGQRAAVYLQGLGTGGYAAFKMGCAAKASEWLVSAGNVIDGFEIRDTNAAATRLSISNTTGVVDAPQGYTVGGTAVSLVGHTHAGQLSGLTAGRLLYATGADSAATDAGALYDAATDTLTSGIRDKGGQVFNVMAYGAVADGGTGTPTDNTAAFQAAINDAFSAAVGTHYPSGIVYVPPGIYRCTGTLNLTPGVTLDGPHGGDLLGENGARIDITSGSGNASGTPFVTMQAGATIRNLAFNYPTQATSGTPTAFPYTIKMDASTTVENIYLKNSYQGIDCASASNGTGVHRIRNVHGAPLLMGIDVDQSYDVGRIEGVHFWRNDADGLATWVLRNGTALRFGSVDWEQVRTVFAYGYKTGIKFRSTIRNGTSNYWACSGRFTDLAFDRTTVGLDLDATAFHGIEVSGMRFAANEAYTGGGTTDQYAVWAHGTTGGSENSIVSTTACLTISGLVSWGTQRSAIRWQNAGRLVATDCHTYQWGNVVNLTGYSANVAAFDITAGRANISDNYFAENFTPNGAYPNPPVAITVTSGADRAIVTNNMVVGKTVTNVATFGTVTSGNI